MSQISAPFPTPSQILAQYNLGRRSAESYGAKGDGTTNDAVAIQAALNAGAGVVELGPKTYFCGTATLNVPARTSLVGHGCTDQDGNGQTIITFSSATADNITLSSYAIGASGTHIQDLIIRTSVNKTAGCAIHSYLSSNCNIQNVTIDYLGGGTHYNGIWLDGGGVQRVIGCHLRGTVFNSVAGNHGLIIGDHTGNAQSDIWVNGGNEICGWTNYGIVATGNVGGLYITDTSSQVNGYGFSSMLTYGSASNREIFFSPTACFDRNQYGGVYFQAGASGTGLKVSGLLWAVGNGTTWNGSTYVNTAGVTAGGASGFGISIDGTLTNGVFVLNSGYIQFNVSRGMQLGGGTVIVNGNYVNNNGSDGIYFGNMFAVNGSGNTVNTNGGTGVLFAGTCTHPNFVGNGVYGNTTAQVNAGSVSTTNIVNNG